LLGVAVLVGGAVVLLVGPGSPPDPGPKSVLDVHKQKVTSTSTAKMTGQKQNQKKRRSDSPDAQIQKPSVP
jgi:hypothetical protein